MKKDFVKELANDVFASMERENPIYFEQQRQIISDEYANNELKLMVVLVERLKASNTLQSPKNLKKLEIIERELWNIAAELENNHLKTT